MCLVEHSIEHVHTLTPNKASEEAEPPMTKPHYCKKRLTGRAATYLFRMQVTKSIYHVSER